MSADDHGYVRYSRGCRCDTCRQAKADYMRDRRAAARRTAQAHTQSSTGNRGSRFTAFSPGASRHVVNTHKHGRYAYDELGCRCEVCTTAKTVSYRKLYPKDAA